MEVARRRDVGPRVRAERGDLLEQVARFRHGRPDAPGNGGSPGKIGAPVVSGWPRRTGFAVRGSTDQYGAAIPVRSASRARARRDRREAGGGRALLRDQPVGCERRRPRRDRDHERQDRSPPPHDRSIPRPVLESCPRGDRRQRARIESALATASDVGRLRLGKMRSRYDLVDAALEAAELDRNRAGGLLAGGTVFRAFVWLLPMALLTTGLLGLVRDFSVENPETVAREVGLAGVIANAVGSASSQSSSATALLIAIGVVLTVYTGMGFVRALRVAYVLAWGLPLGRRPGLPQRTTACCSRSRSSASSRPRVPAHGCARQRHSAASWRRFRSR